MFFLTVTVVLGFGVACAAVGFSVVEVLVLRPLPFEEASHLVTVDELDKAGRPMGGSLAAFNQWRTRTDVFSGVAGYRLHDLNLTGRDRPMALIAASVTGDFFSVLRQSARLGRVFTREEAETGSKVVVLTHRFWMTRFGGRQDVIGEQFPLAGRNHTISGVLASDFRFLQHVPDVVIPIGSRAENDDASLRSTLPIVVARLQPGVGIPQALQSARQMEDRLAHRYPKHRSGWNAGVVSLHDKWMGSTRGPALMMFVAVAVLLIVACINTAGLILARGMRRQKETAVRYALGAKCGHIAKDLLAEGALLTFTGSVVGLGLAVCGLRALVAVLPAEVTSLVPGGSASFRVNAAVTVFAVLASTLTAGLCSLSPLLQMTSVGLPEMLRSAGATFSRDGHRGREILVISQVALSIILLIAGGLLLKGYWTAQQTELGFEPRNLLAMWVGLAEERFSDTTRRVVLYDRVLMDIQTLPGVHAATAADLLPNHEDQGLVPFSAPRVMAANATQWPRAGQRSIGDTYFATLRIPLVRGRAFDTQDHAGSMPVVIVSQSLASSYFAGDPLEQSIRLREASGRDLVARIVGVAADVRAPLQRGSTDVVYRPLRQAPPPMVYFLARTERPESVLNAARQTLWRVDPEQPMDGPWIMDAQLSQRLAVHRFSSAVVGGVAGGALLLACLGIYGLMSYLVVARRKEIGIRMAVGASPKSVIGLVLGRGLRLVVTGLAAGLLLAFGGSSVLQPYLLGVSRFDVLTHVGVAVLLVAVSAAASALPAIRAAKLDPNFVLRLD